MAMASIDNLAPTRSLNDLDFIFDDILLVEYVDETDEGDEVIRNGIVVPTNALTKAWRKGRIILAGPETKYAKEGDIVIFPNNMGVTISNITVSGKKKVKKGIFLNEERMFGICKRKDDSSKSSS